MLSLRNAVGVACLAATLVVAGCNVLDAAYEEGGSVENLIEDASYARINQDFDRAETLLRQAFELEPGNPVVRLELASTLMQREQINLLDLAQVTAYVLDEIDSEGGQARGAAADTCTWDSDEPTRPFDPNAVEGYEEIAAAAPLFAEVLRLLNDPASPTTPPVIPAELGELDPCTVIQDGVLVYDRDALLETLRAHFDGDDARVNAALTMNAIALTLHAYVGLFENPEVPVNWFLVGEPGNARLGFCMDRAGLDAFNESIDASLDAIAEAFFSLDLLIHHAGDRGLRPFVDEALALFDTFEGSFGRFCGN